MCAHVGSVNNMTNPFTYLIDLLDEYDYMGPIGAFVGVAIAIITCFILGGN